MAAVQGTAEWQGASSAEGLGARLRQGLADFHKRHLARRGTYSHARAFLPIPALGVAWCLEFWRAAGFHHHGLLNATVTIEHLFEALSTVTFWAWLVSRVPHRLSRNRAAFQNEAIYLLRNSMWCGALMLLLVAVRGYWLNGLRIGFEIFADFSFCSVMLLGLAVSSTMGWIPDPRQSRKVLIIGSGPRAAQLYNLAVHDFRSLHLVGFLDDRLMPKDHLPPSIYLGGLKRLPELLKEQPVDLVLIGLPVRSMYETIQNVLLTCELAGVECHYQVDIFDTKRTPVAPSMSSPLIAAHGQSSFDVRRVIKRLMDIVLAGIALALLSPVFLMIALAVWVTSKGPVVFVQRRYGLNRKRFPMFKFRSMVIDAEALQVQLESQNEAVGPVFKMRRDPRVTKVGEFLRKTSLDELPQLVNVLRGEMSIVGPRPLPIRDVSKFDEPWLLRRFTVRPGITCLWQVCGRSDTKFDDWMLLDLRYIDTWSLTTDLSIMLQTVPAVLRGHGAM